MTLDQALSQAISAGLARLDAQLLLLHTLRMPASERAWLASAGTDTLSTADAMLFGGLCQRRLKLEPLAYIVGQKAFYGLNLRVDKRVLDPRDDTETLVEWALTLPMAQDSLVLDLGTGSGAIALALQSQHPKWQVHASDASDSALQVAKANALALRLPVQFHLGSWFSALPADLPPFHLIVSNPPYIAEGDPHLAALLHEPRHALTSGPMGLDALSHIIAKAHKRLAPGGWLLLEHGHDQAAAVRIMLIQAGFDDVQSKCDLAGIERCSGGQRLIGR